MKISEFPKSLAFAAGHGPVELDSDTSIHQGKFYAFLINLIQSFAELEGKPSCDPSENRVLRRALANDRMSLEALQVRASSYVAEWMTSIAKLDYGYFSHEVADLILGYGRAYSHDFYTVYDILYPVIDGLAREYSLDGQGRSWLRYFVAFHYCFPFLVSESRDTLDLVDCPQVSFEVLEILVKRSGEIAYMHFRLKTYEELESDDRFHHIIVRNQ